MNDASRQVMNESGNQSPAGTRCRHDTSEKLTYLDISPVTQKSNAVKTQTTGTENFTAFIYLLDCNRQSRSHLNPRGMFT
jgi:hypothetical protein